ncbi:hypothetical protein [Planococcus faecalis]|uniref:hypothetical protein n=1 Tax=Planococcus faecalis TaxID=1598147 RepID=UPI0034E93670
MVEIRKGTNSDAEQIVRVIKNAEESGYMLFDPGERKVTPESFAKFIDATNEHEKSGILLLKRMGKF